MVRHTRRSRSISLLRYGLIVVIVSFILILNDLGDYLWGWRDYKFSVDTGLAQLMYVNVDLVVNMPCHCEYNN